MPTVRKTSPGQVTVHGVGTFEQGGEQEVSAGDVEYLTEERGDFVEVFEAIPDESPSVEEETEPEPDTGDSEPKYDGPEAAIEDGVCPWCLDYDGEHVGQHASSAHPDEWAEYQEGDD